MRLSLRQRIDGWFLSRRPPSDRLQLTQRNVYIVPSRAGWMLAATVLVLLVASINYQLNLGYLLTFLLAGSVAAGMYVSHATLRGLALHLLPPEPQFAGAPAVLRVVLDNDRRTPRWGIGIAVRGAADDAPRAAPFNWAWSDVPALGSSTVEVAFRPARRGLHAVPPLVVETRFPLGTFRVWTVWRPAAQVLVYPAPEAHPPPLPPGEPRAEAQRNAGTRTTPGGEYDGVRAYRRGDPLKMIVWKKVARAMAAGSGELYSRETQQSQLQELWLDAQLTGLSAQEARLSRLAAWVLMADRLGIDYGLRVASRQIALAQGEAHKRQCLALLATC